MSQSPKSLNWKWIKEVLAFRREKKKLLALGYKQHETDWDIHRGPNWEKVIIDAKVSVCGKYVYTLIGDKP